MTADAVGGVWRYSVDLGAALVQRGVRTTVAVMGPAPDEAQRREADRAGLTIVDRPYRLEWMDEPWQDVERAGRWLLSLERTLQPDVVHLNGYSHAALPWYAPVMVVAHSCVGSWWRAVKGAPAPDRFDTYRAWVSRGLTAARLVVAPTRAMLDALHQEYGPSTSARVIANGSAEIGCAEPPAAKEPLILAAGRLWDEGKNVDAVCSVAGSWPWPVYVAGDQQAPGGAERTLAGVHSLGRLAPEELGAWRRRAAIYVSPARYEPFGLSILEAAGAGCALVLGDIPSLHENWDGAAVFVPADDREALRMSVARLIADAPRREEIARRARERAAAFTIDRAADAYLRAYQDLVA
jgi:glycogen synthase